jgi:hypothetical protein
MSQNQEKQNTKNLGNKKTSRLKTTLILVGLVLALLILKVVLILTAKPKITVSYLDELNRISKPDDYDPNKNALKDYGRAVAEYVEMPKSLSSAKVYWPYWIDDTNQIELDRMRKWLEQNLPALERLKEAAEKNYLWRQRCAEKNLIAQSKPLVPKYPYLSRLLRLRAKLNPLDGRFDLALQALLTDWKLAQHYTNPKLLLTEQYLGMRNKSDTIERALLILDLCDLDPPILKAWQKTWQEQFDQDKYIPGFQSEKLTYYERIQICFTDDGRGDGRLIWSAARSLTCPYCTPVYLTFLDWIKAPTRRQTVLLVDAVSDLYEKIAARTPWQQHIAPEHTPSKKEQQIRKNETFDFLVPDHQWAIYQYYELKAAQQALLAAIALLRYNAENESYPVTLQQLVEQKYLPTLPLDPFSDKPLVYKSLDDDFELYSAGQDYKDDGGARYPGGGGLCGAPEGDEVFWPPLTKGRKNIKTYWPLKDIPPLKNPNPYSLKEKQNARTTD